MTSARSGSVSVHIDAPAETVWEVLSHLERMGEWSPECYRVRWEDGPTSPLVPGARFRGWNRFGWMRWSVACQVKSAVPARELSFATLVREREMTTWSYHIRPVGQGVDLVESFQVHWLPPSARIAEDYLMRDRNRRRQQAMLATLENIKRLAEAQAPSAP